MKKVNYHEFRKKLEGLEKTYFNILELKKIYGSEREKSSLKNLLSRWSKDGLIFSLGNSYYCFDIARLDYLNFACNIVKPSYISFEYALNFYGLVEQVQQVITLTTVKRHKFVYSGPYTFEYTKIKEEMFFGYDLVDSYYIATPEKALLDTIYLVSRNKRLVDLDSLNYKKINKKRLFDFAKRFPKYIIDMVKPLLIL